MSGLRPRVDYTVVLNGVQHEGFTTLKDTLETKKVFSDIEKEENQLVIMTKVVYCACLRKGVFEGSFEEFVDALDDYEIDEPAPLSKG